MIATCPSYAISDKDLAKKLLTSNQNFIWNGFTLQGDEAGKLPIICLCLCVECIPF